MNNKSIEFNSNNLLSAASGTKAISVQGNLFNNSTIGTEGISKENNSGATIGPASDTSAAIQSSEPISGIDKYDPYLTESKNGMDVRNETMDGKYVQQQAEDGTYYLGTINYQSYTNMFQFNAVDKEAFEKSNSFGDSVKSITLAGMDVAQETISGTVEVVSYVGEPSAISSAKAISDIYKSITGSAPLGGALEYPSNLLHEARENLDNASSGIHNYLYDMAPHKGEFNSAQFAMNLAMAIDGALALTKVGIFVGGKAINLLKSKKVTSSIGKVTEDLGEFLKRLMNKTSYVRSSEIFNRGDVHLTNVEGFNKKRQGLIGGHSLAAIEEYSKTVRPIEIIGKAKESKIEGVYEIIYKAGKLDAQGKPISGELYPKTYTKTVYDPNIIPDDTMKVWAKEALEKAPVDIVNNEPYVTGTAKNGLKFEGWIDSQTQEITSYYPIIE